MSFTENNGGSAFPHSYEDASKHPNFTQSQGMTLRDAAALAALPAIIQECGADSRAPGETHEQMYARKALAVANAFIAARDGGDNAAERAAIRQEARREAFDEARNLCLKIAGKTLHQRAGLTAVDCADAMFAARDTPPAAPTPPAA